MRADATALEKNISFDIKVYDEMVWRRKPFTFDPKVWDSHNMPSTLREKLCLGDPFREYTVIGEAFPFPDREDSPVVNEPAQVCRLLWDHTSPTEKVMIQLSDHAPPLLWLSVKPTVEALRKMFAEFLDVDAAHMKLHLPYYESLQASLEKQGNEKFGESLSAHKMRDAFVDDMRKRDPATLSLEWPHSFDAYIGTTDHFRLVEDKWLKHNPFVFGWPLLLSEGNHFMEGTPVKSAAFRTLYSKSLVMLHSRGDMQLNPRLAKIKDDDEDEILLEVPVFTTVNYATNTRMCGGKALIERYNASMGTSFPLDCPVDVLMSFCRESVKSAKELRTDMNFLAAASKKVPDPERVIRLSPSLSGSNRILGQLAYTMVYLAIVEDPQWERDVFGRFAAHPDEVIRTACAKGAQVLRLPALIDKLIAVEPEGRTRELFRLCRAAAS